MKHLFPKIMIAAFTLAAFAACSGSDESNEDPVPVVEPSYFQFTSSESKAFQITYPNEWTASLSDDSWCSIDKTSGDGDGSITLRLTERTEHTRLSTVLTVASSADPSLKQSVTLVLPALELAVSPSPVLFSRNLREAVVSVTYAGKWTAVLSDDSWCSADRTDGNGTGVIKLTMTSEDFGGMSSTLTVTADGFPGLNSSVSIMQTNALLHGELTVLNNATIGAGVHMVIMGDGFTASDMEEGGKWASTIQKCRDALFKLEPFTSFREYINLYAVSVVSKSDEIGLAPSGQTFFRSYFNGDRQFLIDNTDRIRAYQFAYENSPVKSDKGKMDDMLLIMLINDQRYGGAGYLDDKQISMGTGMGTSSMNSQYFDYLAIHESLGHAFGKLADEYVTYAGSIEDINGHYGTYQSRIDKAGHGWWQNVEFTSDPEQFDNTYWRDLYKESYPEVTIAEGGYYCQRDVWRSSYNSIMNSAQSKVFNAVSREILVRRIYKLAGMAPLYSLDVFKEYDVINTISAMCYGPAIDVPPASYLRPPIVAE